MRGARPARVNRLVGEIADDVASETARGTVPSFRVLLERLEDDRFEVTLELGTDRAGPRWGVGANHLCRREHRQPLHIVRRATREQLEEQDAERVDVAARIEIVQRRIELLGRHVLDGPDEPTGLGVHRLRGKVELDGAGHAEVDDLRITRLVDEDVARLEVAVDDLARVAVLDGGADLDEELEAVAQIKLFLRGVFEDRPGAGDVLHDEVRHGTARCVRILVHPRVVDLGDIRVTEPAEDLDLALEAPQGGTGVDGAAHHLDRDGAAGLPLEGGVDGGHPARPEHALDLESADLGRQVRPIGSRVSRFVCVHSGCGVGARAPAHASAGIMPDWGRNAFAARTDLDLNGT
jgi:hypothetical protein